MSVSSVAEQDAERLQSLLPTNAPIDECEVLAAWAVWERMVTRRAESLGIGASVVRRGLERLLPTVGQVIEEANGLAQKVEAGSHEARDQLIWALIEARTDGFLLAAAAEAAVKTEARSAGAKANAVRAQERWQAIADAYDATDDALPEAERYRLVSEATGVRSVTTIRKALTLR